VLEIRGSVLAEANMDSTALMPCYPGCFVQAIPWHEASQYLLESARQFAEGENNSTLGDF